VTSTSTPPFTTPTIMVSYETVKETTKKLVHWDSGAASGGVFGSVLGLLVAISYFSLISVAAYIALAALAGVMAIKVYSFAMVFLKKAEPGSDPLQCVTNLDVNIPPEKVADMTGFLVDILNPSIMELRRLFLLESIFDTIKFILCLWGLTYIGSWFNMMTLVILTWVGFFTVPLVYKNNQAAVDDVLGQVNTQITDIKEKVMGVIPIKSKPTVLKKEE